MAGERVRQPPRGAGSPGARGRARGVLDGLRVRRRRPRRLRRALPGGASQRLRRVQARRRARAADRASRGVRRAHGLAVLAARPQLPAHDAAARRRARRAALWSTIRSAARRRRPHLARATLQLVDDAARPAPTTSPEPARRAGTASRPRSWRSAGLDARVEPISSSELQRPAPRPACSILRTVHADAPRLPHWRDGLRDCLAALANAEGT